MEVSVSIGKNLSWLGVTKFETIKAFENNDKRIFRDFFGLRSGSFRIQSGIHQLPMLVNIIVVVVVVIILSIVIIIIIIPIPQEQIGRGLINFLRQHFI